MRFVPVTLPKFITRLFPNYVWDFSSKDKVIYLTFDDGPTPEITNWTLNLLKQYKAKATFFCIGNNVKQHPQLFKTILEQGHSIGNHTNTHISGWKTSTATYLKNVKEAHSVISSQLEAQQTLNLFRPPFGKIKNSQGRALKTLGYKIIMWSVITFDWDKAVTQQNCLEYGISKTKNGSIVVFHDSVKASKNMQYALPKFLEHFSNKGYTFKAIVA